MHAAQVAAMSPLTLRHVASCLAPLLAGLRSGRNRNVGDRGFVGTSKMAGFREVRCRDSESLSLPRSGLVQRQKISETIHPSHRRHPIAWAIGFAPTVHKMLGIGALLGRGSSNASAMIATAIRNHTMTFLIA